MKPIIVDIKDMSDSTEVYESRPNPVLTGFIYLILAMVALAFVWMGFFKMDVVVDAMGTVSAAGEVATITNQLSGTITGRMIEDGQIVNKGDILYTISHEELSIQLASLEKQLADSVDREEMLKMYDAWLQDGTDFALDAVDNSYYSEISTRKVLVEIQGESLEQSYSKELSAYETKLSTNANMAAYYEEAIAKSRQLIEAIKGRSNPFDSADAYYHNYMENYIVQYQNTGIQYESKLNSLRMERENVDKTIKEIKEQIAGLQNKLQESAPAAIFVSGGDMVSGGDAVISQEEILQLEQEIQSLKSQISTLESSKSVVDTNISDYILQKNSALDAYEKESIASVENNILVYEQNLASCEGVEREYINSKNALEEQGVELGQKNLVAQEVYSVAGELESCRQTQVQLQQQISSLEKSIENATVRATMSGIVNLDSELVEGDYLSAGATVLTIIPQGEDSAFIVKSYVENADIAKIHEGMEVTYEIGAYPSREYGTMTGEVTFVSADLKVNNNGSAYYVVETSVNPGELRNRMGEEAALKVGMLCETKVVIENKTVLELLLEKLFG